MNCDVKYDKGQTLRPAYVPATFAGRCKVYPQPLADGREPRLLSYQSSWINDNGIMLIAEKIAPDRLDMGQRLWHRPPPRFKGLHPRHLGHLPR